MTALSHDRTLLHTSDALTPYKAIGQWKKGLKRKSKKKALSPSTWHYCLRAMCHFLDFLHTKHPGLTPDDLIAEGQKNIDTPEEWLADFFNWLQGKEVEGYLSRKKFLEEQAAFQKAKGITRTGPPPKPILGYGAARQLAYSRIAGFFGHNKIRLPPGITPPSKPPEVRQIDETYTTFDHDEENDRIIAKFGYLRQLLANFGFRDQTICLCLLTTSQDPIDLFKLDVGFIRMQMKTDHKRFYWQGTRTKTVEPFKTFFSQVTSEFLKKYIAQERKDAPDDAPLFVLRPWGNEKEKRMTPYALAKVFREAQHRMGIENRTTQSPFRPKRMRHIFRDACAAARIDVGYIHCFMGHSSDISGQYLNKPRSILEAIYSRVEPYLEIFKSGLDEDLDTIRTQLRMADKEREEISQREKEMMAKIITLHEEMGTKDSQLKLLTEKVDTLSELVITLWDLDLTTPSTARITEAEKQQILKRLRKES